MPGAAYPKRKYVFIRVNLPRQHLFPTTLLYIQFLAAGSKRLFNPLLLLYMIVGDTIIATVLSFVLFPTEQACPRLRGFHFS